MSELDPTSNDWHIRARSGEDPFSYVESNGVLLISSIANEALKTQEQVARGGHVIWRAINRTVRRRRIRADATFRSKRAIWEPNPGLKNDSIHINEELLRTREGDQYYAVCCLSEKFSIQQEGLESALTAIHGNPDKLESRFIISPSSSVAPDVASSPSRTNDSGGDNPSITFLPPTTNNLSTISFNENSLFFLSYARRDRNDANPEGCCVRQFYGNLVEEIRRKLGHSTTEIAFFDAKDINHGATWTATLEKELATCRSLIPLFSPAYFKSTYCGKEWELFYARVTQYSKELGAGNGISPLILPVIFEDTSTINFDQLPSSVTNLQYHHDDYPSIYRQHGLRYIMERETYKDEYRDFVAILASKLIQSITTHSLPPLQTTPSIKDIKSAFHKSNQS